ncbi:unnamed protein product, partial [Ceratitis capitata]
RSKVPNIITIHTVPQLCSDALQTGCTDCNLQHQHGEVKNGQYDKLEEMPRQIYCEQEGILVHTATHRRIYANIHT